MRTLRLLALLPALLLLAAACASRPPQPAAGTGGASPLETVDRFMRLADAFAYLEMGWVFGTAQGPVALRDRPANVERRMAMIASVLTNESYQLAQPRPIPGRVGQAVQVDVTLRSSTGGTYLVPFTAVSAGGGRWLVEHVAIEAVTTRR